MMQLPGMPTLSGPQWGPAAGGPPASLIVLLHGVGADGHDLIELAPLLAPLLPQTLFIAPDAPEPCDLAPFGRQWFSLADRRPEALLAGVARAAPVLDAYLDGLLAQYGLTADRLALLGFSQGTMLALHAAPRRPAPLAAVLGYSGALIDDGRLAAEHRSAPPVLLIHGDADEVIPQLYAYTDCSVSVASNLIVIDDRKPVQLTVSDITQRLTERLKDQLKRELEYDRGELVDRKHWLTLEQIFVEKRGVGMTLAGGCGSKTLHSRSPSDC